ncbi:MAG TPA: ankyrin repeat domain-containing protein [Planctomycetota bacterium]|nr:ankyrin repeat domain-containing protein [Planctomycetota bacterium]
MARDVERYGAPVEGLVTAATACDWAGIVRALDAGAAIDWPVFDGGTVLHLAIYHGQAAFAQELVTRGASAKAEDEFGRTPLHWVAEMSATPGLADLITPLTAAGADVNAADRRGRTALHAAAVRGGLAVVAGLLHAGADINARKADGVTPLQFAVIRNHGEVAELLLLQGADPTLVNDAGETALMLAQKLGREGLVARLVAWRPGAAR